MCNKIAIYCSDNSNKRYLRQILIIKTQQKTLTITDKNEIRNKINATYKDAILREKFEVLVYLIVPFKEVHLLSKMSVPSQKPLATETLLAGGQASARCSASNRY